MHIYTHSFSLLPADTLECSGVVYNQSLGMTELESSSLIGTFKTQAFEAKLAREYVGFQILPDQEVSGVSVALVDESGEPWSYQDGIWSIGGWNTPEQMRSAMPTLAANWASPVQFLIKLERQGVRSPRINQLKIGFVCAGNLLVYLLEFALPKLLSTPVELTRWLPAGVQEIPDFDSDRIVSTSSYAFHDHNQVAFRYRPICQMIQSGQIFQVEEIPCILLQLLDTENLRLLSSTDSLRVSADQAHLYETAYTYDQPIEITILAQTQADVRQIADHLIGLIEQSGAIHSPAYGTDTPIMLTGHIQSTADTMSIEDSLIDGTLPSLKFQITLFNLPLGKTYQAVDILREIQPVQIAAN